MHSEVPVIRLVSLVYAISLLLALPLSAAETRGLRVVAKDPVTNQTDEVTLYNKSYAVVIGIDQYQNLTADRQLHNAVRDAKGVADVLHRNYRFDRIYSLYNRDATKERILELLTEELPKGMGEEDSVFIFWAGHGNQEVTAGGDIGYLIPYDGSTDKIRKNITMTEIRDTISNKIPAKHVFYVMDACYSGLLASRSVDVKTRRDLKYLQSVTKERVRQVLTAGGKGEEVLDGGPKGHSVFTGRLIEALEAAGDFITANEIQAILKERVYGDALGRGKAQTPGFGTLAGSGDFVFVPNIEQKVQDNKAEVAKMEAELKRLEAQETEARKYQSEQEQREAEQKRKAAEARLKAEQLRQQQLADEAQRQQEMAAERGRFEAEQKKRERELTAAQKAEEQRLAALKAELAKKKQAAPLAAGNTLSAAVAEIKRLNSEIEGIEATFSRELSAGIARITSRYESEIAAVRQQSSQKQAPLVRDEFETESEYQARVSSQKSAYRQRISELEQKSQREVTELEQRLAREQQTQTADLRQSLKQLSEKQFTIGAEIVAVELGSYNPEKQSFPVTLRSTSPGVKVAMNGTLPLPRDAARSFKQQYQAGAIRPQLSMKTNGDIMTVALANDADNSIYEYVNGDFMTVAERKRREAERERERERERELQTVGEMVSVPSGCFNLAGSQVCLDAFRIGKYEVTQGQWKRIMGNNPSRFSSCGDNCPVEQVSWNDAQEFISKLNRQTGKSYRLPTEVEWEYACRAGEQHEYCGSSDVDAVAWYDRNSGNSTHPVGQKQANAWGIHDMSGNVWEWVSDWYGGTYPSSASNPQGPSSGSRRVIRGGGWNDGPRFVRAAIRDYYSPDYRNSLLGLRLAAPVQ